MKRINLKDFYPFYEEDCYVDVPDELAALMQGYERQERAYAHILDEDRKINAQKFDSAFYSNPDLRQVKAPQAQGISAEQLLSQLKESPELASALAQLLAGGKAG